ncbi:MAG TPA: HAD-IA family hydrolase [Acidimicrobiales bacterium]
MSSPIEAVVLDLGGVVCRFAPDRRLQALSRMTGVPASDIHATLWASGLDARADAGDLEHDEAYVQVLDRLDGKLTATDLRVAWAAAFEPDEEVLALVRALDRPTVLFSNNGPITEDCLQRELAVVGFAFDTVLLSWRLGATKPAAEAYSAAAKHIGVRAQALLYVDDDGDCVRAAAHRGWIAHPYRGAGRLRRLFEAHDLLRRHR